MVGIAAWTPRGGQYPRFPRGSDTDFRVFYFWIRGRQRVPDATFTLLSAASSRKCSISRIAGHPVLEIRISGWAPQRARHEKGPRCAGLDAMRRTETHSQTTANAITQLTPASLASADDSVYAVIYGHHRTRYQRFCFCITFGRRRFPRGAAAHTARPACPGFR